MKHRINIHHRGHGCLSDVNTAITGIVWCVDNGHEWYVDWRNNLYSDEPDANLWDRYFKQPLTGKETFDVVHENVTPAGWGWGTFRTDRSVPGVLKMIEHPAAVARDMLPVSDWLFGTPPVLLGDIILGVHRRGTDRNDNGPMMDDERFAEVIHHELARTRYDRILCITDSQRSLDYLRGQFGDMLITTGSLTSKTEQALHRGGADSYSKTRLADEVIRDAALLARCDFRLYTASNVAVFSLLCNPAPNFRFLDECVKYPI